MPSWPLQHGWLWAWIALAISSISLQVARAQQAKAKTKMWSPKPPIFTVENSADGGKHETLYPPDGPVESLVGDPGIQRLHENPNVIWIVEFYSAGCPHCWYFAPLFQTLARAFAQPDKVRFGAVNCIDLVNIHLCKGVQSYPMMYIHNLPKVEFTYVQPGLCQKGLIVDQTGTYDNLHGCAERCKGSPECGFFSYNMETKDCGVYQQQGGCLASSKTGYRSYVMKEPMNAGPVQVDVEQANGQGPLSAKLLAELLTQQYAAGALEVFNPQALNTGMDVSGSNIVSPDGVPGRPGWPNELAGTPQSRRHDAMIGSAKLLMDGYTDAGKFQAARSIISFLSKVFPENNAAFVDLNKKLEAKDASKPEFFKAIVSQWAAPFDPKLQFCFSKPCSVWELLHTVTAAVAAVKLTGQKLFLQASAPDVSVDETMGMVRTMVDSFLDCEACKKHFVNSYDGCLFGRCEVLDSQDEKVRAKAMVLWLWRTHDAVSVRVISENPPAPSVGSIDRRWPPYRDCPGCWKYSVVVDHKPGKNQTWRGMQDFSQPTYDIWNEDKVFEYLMIIYLGRTTVGTNWLEKHEIYGDRLFHSELSILLKSSPLMSAAVTVGALLMFFALVSMVRRRKKHYDAIEQTDATEQLHASREE